MRLQKYLAKAGIASRRKSETLIIEGRVSVNNKTITELGTQVDIEKDVVAFDHRTIQMKDQPIYIMLNKPTGYITSVSDEKNRKTVMNLIPIKERIYPVGRLDYHTSGLLLLTNDGRLTYRLTHPKHEVNKKYRVRVKGHPSEASLELLRKGTDLGVYKTSKAAIRTIKSGIDTTLLEVVIHEGKNRIIRRLFESIKHPVIKLKRIAIGNIMLGSLESGEYRNLNKQEVEYLNSI